MSPKISLLAVVVILSTCAAFLYSAETKQPSSIAMLEKADKSATPEVVEHVPRIEKIEYAIEKTNPPNLIITVHGVVPTGGWKNIQLVRRIYVNPPADGIWEYDLFGIPPTDPVIQVETPVKASNTWKEYDQSIKGVRIYGIGRGIKEIRLKENE